MAELGTLIRIQREYQEGNYTFIIETCLQEELYGNVCGFLPHLTLLHLIFLSVFQVIFILFKFVYRSRLC